ncbi:TetR/AcrR family transcriptional regulator [Nonomuraea indica]|uniref:TetR/AcrR family transcriptional regulator n=1 Tax=Nonomuraea indica TaxID=1581193 RepID=UPI000C7B764A|nr:TetR/AcrR family transcriptional regulator [Nonomuraea indica]
MKPTETRHRPAGAGRSPGAAPRRRADAERSITAIVEAAQDCLAEQPQVSMAAIARAAGVGRVTLYAHFPSREVLFEAVIDHAIAKAEPVLDAAAPGDGPAADALCRLLRSSWQVLDRHRRLFEVAQHELGAVRMRERHDQAMARVEQLLHRGRAEGAFRDDLPLAWMVTTVYSLLHAAAADVNAGRLPQDSAAETLIATLLPALRPPR